MKKIIYSHSSNFRSPIIILIKVLLLSSILSITINSLLAMNLDGSKQHHPHNRVMFYPLDSGKLYCKALSYVRYNDIFYHPIISKLPCPSKAYVEILCREDKTFNKKDYIILSCFPNNSYPIDLINPNSKTFSTCTVTKQDIMLTPESPIPPKSIACDYINNSYFYLDEAFYINRVMDY